jgi:hypothetical protein
MSMSVGFNPLSAAQAPTPTRQAQRNDEDRPNALEKMREAAKPGEQEEQQKKKTSLKGGGGTGDIDLSVSKAGGRVDIEV